MNLKHSASVFTQGLVTIVTVTLMVACGGGGGGSTSSGATSSTTLALLAGKITNPASNNFSDGTGSAADFNTPYGIATDSSGSIYVADATNHSIRLIVSNRVTTLAGSATAAAGNADGTGVAALFNSPTGVAVDSSGNIYVADQLNNNIRKITIVSGVATVSTLAGSATAAAGSADGAGLTTALFNSPTGVATDSAGNIYVTDTNNSTIRMITASGAVSTLAGSSVLAGHADGSGTVALFNNPTGIATDSSGNVYVADTNNSTIRKITFSGAPPTSAVAFVTTLAGSSSVIGHADGLGTLASFYHPNGLTVDTAGNVYVADSSNSTIRKITPAGLVTTVVGVQGMLGFTPGALPGVLMAPLGVAISGTSLYITTGNAVVVVNPVP